METVAELKHFYFAYKKNNLVLHDIDFKIEKGSFTVIAGPSGSGKTTLCKAMAGIVPFYMGGAYSGEVMVLGESTKGKKVSDIAMRSLTSFLSPIATALDTDGIREDERALEIAIGTLISRWYFPVYTPQMEANSSPCPRVLKLYARIPLSSTLFKL